MTTTTTTGTPTLLSTNLLGTNGTINTAGFDGRERIELTFSEAIVAGAGAIEIRKADGTLVETFDLSDHSRVDSRVSLAGAMLTLTPTWALESSADHYLTIAAGALKDAEGNGFAGVSAQDPLAFRTGAESVVNVHEQPFVNGFPGNNRETIGEHTLLYVRTTYSDQLNAPWSEWTWMYDNSTMDEFWAYNSNGRLSVTSSFVSMLTLDTTQAFHEMTNVRSWDEGIGFAKSLGYDFGNYDAGVVGNNDWPTGVSFGGGKYIYNAWTGSAVLWHEAGHEIGFGHPITIASPYDTERIGWEGHSRMGGGPSHYGLFEKLSSGWLEWDSIVTDPGAGEYRIHPFDTGYLSQDGTYGLYINSAAPGFDANGFDWMVQHRSAQIAEKDGTDEADLSDELILVRRGGNARLEDHVELGETVRIPGSNTYLTALDKGDGFLEASIRYGLVAQDGSFLDNVAPAVSFTATASAVQAGQSVTFRAAAYDAEQNALTYTWSFSDGVKGTGPVFTRSFDQTAAGTITATLTANDLRTGITSVSADIAVGAAATDSTVLTAGTLPAEATRATPLVTIQTRDAFAKESGDTATLVLERFGTLLAEPLTVALSYEGTGLADVTAASLPQTVTFAAGAKEVELVITMLADDAVEAVEQITVSLVAAAADAYTVSGSDHTARVNLLDDDLAIVSIATLDGFASEAGRDSGTFLLTRTGSVAQALTVNYNSFGTALHGTDYAALSGAVTFGAGERSTILTIQPIDNDAGEAIEAVSLMLTDFSSSYDVDRDAFVASLEIHDNDRPHVQAHVTSNAAEGGTVGVTVEALGKPGETVTVVYDLAGSATAGVDYQMPAGRVDVTIGAGGRGTSVVNFHTNDDQHVEPDELVQLTVRESADYGIGTDRVATFVIRDNDSSLPTVMISPYSDYTAEGDEGGLRFYIQRSNTSGDLVVNYNLGGTATPGADYGGLTGSVTIADGESGVTIMATPIDDASVEGNETITVSIAPADTYRLGVAHTATLAIADNDSGEYGFGFDLLSQELTWSLLANQYAVPEGFEADTTLRVADIDPAAWTYAFNGGSINNKDGAATVNPYTVVATDGQVSFWLEAYDDGYTKAVRLELTDTTNGLIVKAVEAGYTTGDARGTDWIATRSSQSVAASADSAGYGVSVIKAVGDAIPDAVVAEATYQPVLNSTLDVAETRDPAGNIRDIAVQIVPIPLTFGPGSANAAGYTPEAPILSGQTFTTGSLGGRDTLKSIAVDGLSASVEVSQLALKVWANNGNSGTLAPSELIATSTTARRSPDADQVVFEFGDGQLTSGAVYAFTLADGTGATLPFTGTLVTPANRLPGDSQAFGDEVVGLIETRWSGAAAFDNESWTGTPTHQEFWTQTVSAVNVGSDYSRRVTGLLEPDVSGNYTFWVAGDDKVRLYLGTDATEGSKTLFASLTDWTNPQQWDRYPTEQQSATVNLEAGKQYWFEVQQYEGGGGDHVAVAWQGPGMAAKAIITAENFAAVQPVDAAADLSFTVTMTGSATTALDQPVSVRVGADSRVYSAATGNNVDWTLLDPATNKPIDSQTLVFNPGETEKFVRVRVNPDAYPEQGESFTLSLKNPAGIGLAPSLGSLRVNITDQPASTAGVEVANRYVRLATDASVVSEADGRVPHLLVALDRPAGTQPITVTLDLAGSAAAGADYTIGSTTLTFQPGESAKSLDLALIADEVGEGLETIVVSIASANGALAIGPETHTVLILDKDRPQVRTSVGFASQGDDGGAVLATATATVADGRSASSWSLVAGNITREGQTTPAFAVDSAGVVTLANPAALPDGPSIVQLTVRVTDDQGAQADGPISVVVNGTKALKEERWSGSAAFEAGEGDEFYGDAGGTPSGQDLTTPPTYTGLLTTTATAVDVGNDYTRRITGFLQPDVDGDYTFWIAADDKARLFLGTDATEASKRLIASLSDWTDQRQWDKFPGEQQSQAITLQAGKTYWFEVLHYDVGGGDHVAVAWQGPGMAEKALITADNFAPIVPEGSFAPYQPLLIENSVISVATLDTAIGTDTGLTATISSGERTRDATLTLTGTADADAAVRIYDGLTPIGTAARSGTTWSFTTPVLAEGEHMLSARVVDVAGTTHITRTMTVDVSTKVTVPAQPVQTVDSMVSLSEAGEFSLVTVKDLSGLGDGTSSWVDTDPAVSDLLMADLKTGLLQLVNRGPASAVTSADVAVTPVSVSGDGRYVVFTSNAVSAFGDGGVAFTDATPAQTQTDLFVYDREASSVRLATWGGNAATTASRGATPIGITADSKYLVYTTEHIEKIGDFTAPAKLTWKLLDSSYATPAGVTKTTAVNVADLDLNKLEIRLDGRTAGSPAVVRQDTVDSSVAGQLTFWVQSSEGTRAVKVQLTDTDTGIEVKALTAATATPTSDWPVSDTVSTGTGGDSWSHVPRDGDAGVGQTFATGSLDAGQFLRNISIQGPAANGATTQYLLKVWKNEGDINTFAPGALVAQSTNAAALPTNGAGVFVFSGEKLDPNTVYLFSLSSGASDHVNFRSNFTTSQLANGRALSKNMATSRDLGMTLELSAAAPIDDPGSIDWASSGTADLSIQPAAVATSDKDVGVGLTTLSVGPADTSDLMRSEVPTDDLAPATDVVAYHLATGAQTLLSHGVTDNRAAMSADVSDVTLSADGRYVLFRAADASRLGNEGVAFSDAAPNVADWFATEIATGQVRLLTRSATDPMAGTGASATLLGTSADGAQAIFSTNDATAFGFSDASPGTADLFAIGLDDGVIRLISRASGDLATTSSGQAVNVERIVGNHVYFTAADATKLGFASDDATDRNDLFRYDLTTGELQLLSHAIGNTSAALGGNYLANSLTVSNDGRYVAFVSDLQGDTGGFDVRIGGHGLLLTDTETGAIRLVNSVDSAGVTLSYSAWAGVGNNPRFFAGDQGKLVWESSYLDFINGGVRGSQFDRGVLLLDFSFGLNPGGMDQSNRLLSHSASNMNSLAGGAKAQLVGVSPDGQLAYFTANDARWFGNDGEAFTDAAPTVNDLFAVDLATRHIDLISGQAGVSGGQPVTFKGITEDGQVVYTLPAQNLVWSLLASAYPGAVGQPRATALNVADFDPSVFVYTFNGDYITNKNGIGAVNLQSVTTTTTDNATQKSFWVEIYEGGYTKAVRLEVSDTADGLLVKATEARYASGDQRGANWFDAGTAGTVAGSASAEGYGISAIVAVDDDIPEAVRAEATYGPPPATASTGGSLVDLWTNPLNLIDLNKQDDATGGALGSDSDNVTDRQAFTLTARVLPNQQVTLLDHGAAVPGGTRTADAKGYVSWSLQEVAVGQHVFSLQDTVQQVPVQPDNSTTSATLVVTVLNASSLDDTPATGTLTVSGIAEEGGSLSASLNALNDPDGDITATTFAWQAQVDGAWVDLSTQGANGIGVGGADTATLAIPDDQSLVGLPVRVVATTTDAAGGVTTFVSAAQTVANVDDEATGTLTVTGDSAGGDPLTATLNGAADADGGVLGTTFRWQTNIGSVDAPVWADLEGANGATLAIDAALVGKQVRAVATTTDALGGKTELQSDVQTVTGVGADHLTVIDNDTADNTVAENATVGTPVGLTVLATDEVEGDAVTITYSLADSAGGLFAIDASTGVVTVAGTLDYETATSHTLIVRATSSDNCESEAPFTIAVTDVNEAPTAVVLSNTVTTIAENTDTSLGVKVADIAVTDDALGTEILSLTGADAASFEIRNGNELWFTGASPDFETKASYAVTANADDATLGEAGSVEAFQNFTLGVTDVTETSTLTISGLAATVTIAENSAYTSATPDLSGAIGAVTWSIEGTDASKFTVNATTGVVSMVARDFEAPADAGADNVYDVTIRATDSNGNTATQTVAVTVTDVTEISTLTISGLAATATVAENSAYTSATPSLTGAVGAVKWSLEGTDAALFTVDASTGVVSMVARDYEAPADSGANNVYDVTLKATDADGNSDTQDVAVTVTEVNDNSVVLIDSDNDENNVAENAVVGTAVGVTAFGTDADAGATVTYALTDNSSGLFAIHATTGVVTVAGILDYETATSHALIVQATSSDGSVTSQTFTLNVTDVDEFALTVSVRRADSNQPMQGVDIQLDNGVTSDTGADGIALFEAITESPMVLSAAVRQDAPGYESAPQAVNLQDAVSILRMIAGLSPGAEAATPTRAQSLAADFDGSGVVSLADALGVLRHAVGLQASQPSWVFVEEGDNESSSILSPGIPGPVTVDVPAPEAIEVHLIGVLRGDVDGSWDPQRYGVSGAI